MTLTREYFKGSLQRARVWLYRLQVMTTKELTQLLRDKVLVGFVLYGFTLAIYFAGSGISFQLNNAQMVVVDNDRSEISREFISRFRAPEFNVQGQLRHPKEGIALLDRGETMLVLDIPATFSDAISKGEPVDVQMQVDATHSTLGFLAVSYGARVASQFGMEYAFQRMGLSIEQVMNSVPRIQDEYRVWYNQNQNDSWFMPINQLLTMITLLSIMLPAAAVVREKEHGTIEQMLVSPLTPIQVLVPKILSMSIVILLGLALSLAFILIPIFNVPLRGSVLLLFTITALYVFANAGLGLLTATFAQNLGQVGLLIVLSIAPILFLSGVYTPPESMPSWLRWIMYLSPLYYFRLLVYGIMLKGVGIASLWPLLAGMLVLGASLFYIGLQRFKRQF